MHAITCNSQRVVRSAGVSESGKWLTLLGYCTLTVQIPSQFSIKCSKTSHHIVNLRFLGPLVVGVDREDNLVVGIPPFNWLA